jgi:hypothetical protein
MSIIINFFGGPGIGKSTQSAELFTLMKKSHMDVELTYEYPKIVAWEENYSTIKDQLFITANQHRNISRLYGKVKYIIVDSPIILGTVYKDIYTSKPEYPSSFYDETFDFFIMNLFKKYNNFNVLLTRDDTTFNQNGRFQNLNQSKEIDETIKNRLNENNISYFEFPISKTTSENIFEYIKRNNI